MTKTYSKSNPASIQKLFGSVAKNYDKTNAVLSFNLHHYWNSQLARTVALKKPVQVLDLCAGTGEIAKNVYEKHPCQITLLDFCPEMLACAKIKMKELPFSYVEGDAQDLPFAKESFHAITVAYGIRNIASPDKCIQEAHRVLHRGGLFAMLELTRPSNAFLRFGHKIYLKTILPVVGRAITSDKKAYEYLCESIDQFIDPLELKTVMEKTGFTSCKAIPLTGGVATLVVGYKKI